MQIKHGRIRILLGLLFCFMACKDDALLDESLPIANQKWEYTYKPAFTVRISDISKPYNLYLHLRHTAAYKYSNLYLVVHQQYPNGRKTSIRIELKLAETDGRWLGKGSGNLYSRQVCFANAYHFPDEGNYVFSVEQNMRENPLAEIQDVGLRVTPHTGH
ncbi:gliding motility-associated lipoprotein GldH [bacterium A37T11]|nr:gliding motility-associated lipoprotein GldH [bacterium A37T11]